MDTETVDRVRDLLYHIAEEQGIIMEEIIVFGSRARDDYREHSDIDILVVSPSFQNVPYHKRPKQFYRHWDYEELPDPEFLCLTPGEFEEKKDRQPHIVHTAVTEGISIA